MKYLKGFYMCVGMFMAVPLPFYVWEQHLFGIMMTTLPLVGGLMGLMWWGVYQLVTGLQIHVMLSAAILCVVPVILSGHIHLDGYMDTIDAHLSRRDIEEKKRILKDPNVGAFAVSLSLVWLILQFASVYVIVDTGTSVGLFVVIPLVSRGLAALATMCLPPIHRSGYASSINAQIRPVHRVGVVIILGVSTGIALWLLGKTAGIVIFAMGVAYGVSLWRMYRQFGGVSGDLVGYGLVVSELVGLLTWGVMLS